MAKTVTICLAICLLSATETWAQTQTSSVPRINRALRSPLGQVLSRNRSTVSPYLRLLQGGGGGVNSGFGQASAIYQTQVRPQIEREYQMQVQQQQIQQMQTQLNEVRSSYRQPSTGTFSTGHPTRYMSYSHYYPALDR